MTPQAVLFQVLIVWDLSGGICGGKSQNRFGAKVLKKMAVLRLPESKLQFRPPAGSNSKIVPRIFDCKPGHDWVHPSIVVHDTGIIGFGLAAMDRIPKGSRVIVFGGTIMNWRQFAELPAELQDIPFQIDDDLLFGIMDPSDVGIGERINHSCNPNTGFVSEMKLVALRDILPGEAVTMDYAACISIDGYQLSCKCGEKNCRGVVRGSDWKDPNFHNPLFDYLQPYLRQKVIELRKKRNRSRITQTARAIASRLTGLVRR